MPVNVIMSPEFLEVFRPYFVLFRQDRPRMMIVSNHGRSESPIAEVAIIINRYIHHNKLISKDGCRQIINPNAQLQRLFGLKKEDILTPFNIHKYWKCHIIKTTLN